MPVQSFHGALSNRPNIRLHPVPVGAGGLEQGRVADPVVYSARMDLALEVRGVSKWFLPRAPLLTPWKLGPRIQALHRVDLQVDAGGIFALLGPNGAGKTTLLKILSTLIRPDEGEVRVKGHSPSTHARQARQALSFAMGEERSFYWRLTARQNLTFFATLYELSRQETARRIDELAEILGLQSSLDRPYEELSTGTRHRLGLGRSFLNRAPILLADEPTRSLDPLSKRELWDVLRRLSRQWTKTILFTTHDLYEATQLADTVGILHQGRLRGLGPPGAVTTSTGRTSLEAAFGEICQDRETGAPPTT